MKVHEFTLVLNAEPSEEQADLLYRVFDDGTLATVHGVPQIHFHRQAASLEEAIKSAISNVKVGGFEVERVEIEPAAVLQQA